MAERSGSSSMDRAPVLKLVCQIVLVVSKWFELGIQLQLDESSLLEIDRDNPTTSLKRTKMFKLWLDSQPDATNRKLLNALRLKAIGEIKLAKQYEDAIMIDLDLLITSNGSSKPEVIEQVTNPVELENEPITEPEAQVHTNLSADNRDFILRTMSHKVMTSKECTLVMVAHNLRMIYANLLLLIQHFVRQKPSNTGLIKSTLKCCLQEQYLNKSLTLAPYWQKIDAITTVDQAFTFLIDNNFIGYVNYQLLERFLNEVTCGEEGNKIIQNKLSEYKRCYGKFIEEPSFVEVIQVFDEYPHLNPSTIIGLPIIVVTLTMKWQKRSKKDLDEWVPFIKENQALLQSMGYKCILITYAVFPIDLLNIMDFLNDPNNIKTLKDNGISIETPSHTLEIEKLSREDERKKRNNPSFTSTEQLSLQQEKECQFTEDQVTELTDSENKRMVQLERSIGKHKSKGLLHTNNRDSGYYTSCENSPKNLRVYTNDD